MMDEITAKNLTIKDLQGRVESLTQKLSTKGAEVGILLQKQEEHDREVEALQRKLDTALEEVEDRGLAIESFREEIHSLREVYHAKEEELYALQKAYGELKGRYANAQRKGPEVRVPRGKLHLTLDSGEVMRILSGDKNRMKCRQESGTLLRVGTVVYTPPGKDGTRAILKVAKRNQATITFEILGKEPAQNGDQTVDGERAPVGDATAEAGA